MYKITRFLFKNVTICCAVANLDFYYRENAML